MNLGMPEMIFIFLLALIIFGPKKLPEIGRQIGKAMAEFKRASNEFKIQIEDEIRQLEYDEQQKKAVAAAPATLEGNVASYASQAAAEAGASAEPAAPEGTVAYRHTAYAAHDDSAAPASEESSSHSMTPSQGSDV